jgi:hypothetical protein
MGESSSTSGAGKAPAAPDSPAVVEGCTLLPGPETGVAVEGLAASRGAVLGRDAPGVSAPPPGRMAPDVAWVGPIAVPGVPGRGELPASAGTPGVRLLGTPYPVVPAPGACRSGAPLDGRAGLTPDRDAGVPPAVPGEVGNPVVVPPPVGRVDGGGALSSAEVPPTGGTEEDCPKPRDVNPKRSPTMRHPITY